jgi:MFS family permease
VTGVERGAGGAVARFVGQTWAPLISFPTFRVLWIAQSVSVLGTWMQTVGAQWFLVHDSVLLVALVQTATMLPVVLLTLPAGALSDMGYRRSLALGGLAVQLVVAALMAVLGATDILTGLGLLLLTALLGSGAAVSGPAMQSIQSDSVDRTHLAQAATLTALSVNVGRAIGPAIGGLVVASIGSWAVFGLNAVTFTFAVALLSRAKIPPVVAVGRRPLVGSIVEGVAYCLGTPAVRRVVVWVLLFAPLSAAVWALLPTVANRDLGFSVSQYGLLLGSIGLGSLASAVVLPKLRSLVSPSVALASSLVLLGIPLLVIGLDPQPALAAVLLVPAGFGYIGVIAQLASDMQLLLPPAVRARGLAVFQICFSGAAALGSAVWGGIGSAIGPSAALAIGGAAVVVLCALVIGLPLFDARDADDSIGVLGTLPGTGL